MVFGETAKSPTQNVKTITNIGRKGTRVYRTRAEVRRRLTVYVAQGFIVLYRPQRPKKSPSILRTKSALQV